MREVLAALQHEIWASWMRHLFAQGVHNDDGTWTMPAWAVQRWQRQMNTSYADLSEQEREGDREQADKVLQLLP